MKKETTPTTIAENPEIINSALPSPSASEEAALQTAEDATAPSHEQEAAPAEEEFPTAHQETTSAGDESTGAVKEAEPENPSPDLQALLAEAEQKGYLRGRNERIEELMREPQPFERQSSPMREVSSGFQEGQPISEPLILNNPRVSIWDR